MGTIGSRNDARKVHREKGRAEVEKRADESIVLKKKKEGMREKRKQSAIDLNRPFSFNRQLFLIFNSFYLRISFFCCIFAAQNKWRTELCQVLISKR